MNRFKEISPYEIDRILSRIGKDWMLISAADGEKSNTMTASWGCMGVLWNKPVLYCFIRPQRYTHEFTEASSRISATFFSEEYRAALTLCGRKSGRELDKVKESGLTPVVGKGGHVYFAEAKLVLNGKKLYTGKIDPTGFADAAIDKNYALKDYHTVYVYEIEEVLIAE